MDKAERARKLEWKGDFHVKRKILILTLFCIMIYLVFRAQSYAGMVWEIEPNDSTASAQELLTGLMGQYLYGDINVEGDHDWYRIGNVSEQSLVFAYMNKFREPIQPNIRVHVKTTMVVEWGYHVVAGQVISEPGDLYFELADMGDNGITRNSYYFSQVVVDGGDNNPEIEANDDITQATPVSAGVMTGTCLGNDIDIFAFQGQKWADILVITDNDPDRDGKCFQSRVTLLDASGSELAIHDNGGYLQQYNWTATFGYIYLEAGTYYVKITRGQYSEDDDYRFAVTVGGAAVAKKRVKKFNAAPITLLLN